MIRVDRFLGTMGAGSRSDIKKYIKAGRVSLEKDGQRRAISDPSEKIPEDSVLIFDGRELRYEEYQYFLLNKPAGVLTAVSDRTRITVLDLVKGEGIRTDIVPVGRLDMDTEGLLFLTNDGALVHKLESPASGIEKEYEAVLDREVSEEMKARMIREFASGLEVIESDKGGDAFVARPAKLTFPGSDSRLARVILTEGRYHQVKRMFLTEGYTVVKLKRLREGSILLPDDLAEGCFKKVEKMV